MIIKEKQSRNRTLNLLPDQILEYSRRAVTLEAAATLDEIVNTTINQDLFDIVDFLPDEFADLIILDPPYNLNKRFDDLKFKQTSDQQYLDYLRSWFTKIVRLLKPGGSLYMCCDWKSTWATYQVLSENLIIKNRITWQREKGRGARSNWKNSMEDIWFAVKDEDNFYFDVEAVKQKRRVIATYKENGTPRGWEATKDGNFRLTYPSNFWDDISVPYWSMRENTCHPTQKPEKLIAKLILASCPREGMVFDPFVGSGTTSVVAKKLGRRYCGVEVNAEYCAWAERRLEMADESADIQGYSGGVFWERNTLIQQRRQAKKQRDEEAEDEGAAE